MTCTGGDALLLVQQHGQAWQLLRVASYSGGLVTLEYASASEGATNVVLMDTTTLAFGSSSPLAMFTKPANALVERVKVIIDTPFNGSTSCSVRNGPLMFLGTGENADLDVLLGGLVDVLGVLERTSQHVEADPVVVVVDAHVAMPPLSERASR